MNALFTLLAAFFVSFVLAGCKDHQLTPPQEMICGTIQGLTCPDKQYCDFGVGQCKIADAQGICKVKPTICTKEYKPVCGCNGKTYGNACEAAAAGASIDYPSECKAVEPQVCGGIAGIRCPGNQICIDDPSDSCDPEHGGADCPGICATQ